MKKYFNWFSIRSFFTIFLISTVLFVLLCETIWFPIRYYAIYKFVPYFSSRNKPFDHLYFAVKHFYIYYIIVFCLMTIAHVILYRSVEILQKKISVLLLFSLYVLFMFFAGFCIFILNRWLLISESYDSTTLIFEDGLLQYLDMLLIECRAIGLFMIVVISYTCIASTRRKC